jgi:hypothetical protein
MNEREYMIWFLATALMTVIVRTFGTLGAADMLHRRKHSPTQPASTPPNAPRVHQLNHMRGHWHRRHRHVA